MSFASFPIRTRQKATVFTDASHNADLSTLTPEDIIPYVLYLYTKLNRVTPEVLQATFKSAEFVFKAQTENIQSTDFAVMDVFVFMYIVTSIPRNHSDSFQGYQNNKAQGLIRQYENYNLVIEARECVLQTNVLKRARAFFDNHPRIYSYCFRTFLGFANPDQEGPAESYAVELLPSVEYTYMLGVKMIEENLIQNGSPLLSVPEVAHGLEPYYAFKASAIRKYVNRWMYAAVLARREWTELSRNLKFSFLWILAGCIGSKEKPSYLRVVVDKELIEIHIVKERFQQLLRIHEGFERSIAVPNHIHTHHETAQLSTHMARVAQWASDSTRRGVGNLDDISMADSRSNV